MRDHCQYAPEGVQPAVQTTQVTDHLPEALQISVNHRCASAASWENGTIFPDLVRLLVLRKVQCSGMEPAASVDMGYSIMHIASSFRRQHAAKKYMGCELVIDDVKLVIGSALQLGGRAQKMDVWTPLLGAIPELDSMAVVNVITALEERFGISVADDEINAATFATLGTLTAFVEQKLGE